MVSRRQRFLVVLVLVMACFTSAASGAGFFRTIGLRVIVPWTGHLFLIGVEATANVDPLVGTAAFYLNTAGQTLITLGANLPLGDEDAPLGVSVRASTGLAFLDTSAFGPSLLLGIGAIYEVSQAEPWIAGFGVEMIYPIAFPTPMITASAGYLFP